MAAKKRAGKGYIAGPMSGYYEFNFASFDLARDELLMEGWEIISPADLDRAAGFDEIGMTGTEPLSTDMKREFARRDLSALLDVDTVFVLKGWRESTGATHEVKIAHWLGLNVIEFATREPVEPTESWSGPQYANKRAETLLVAESLVNGDRNAQYGDPNADFARTAALWNAYKGMDIITTHDVAVMMALLKISRISWNPKKLDSWIDLAGYAACGADCAEAK